MPVISFSNAKGGTGMTTSAIILSTTLARDYSVTVIDADPAQRLMSWAEKADLPARLTTIASEGERHIHSEITKAQRVSDFVIVDLEGIASRLNGFVMGESDLVIIPMGDEQSDAEGAIEALAELALQARALRREIPVRILFARTKAAVKSRLERSLNAQVRDRVGSFKTELHVRSAFSALHAYGGTLQGLDSSEVTGIEKAIRNAELLTDEVISVMSAIWESRRQQARENRWTGGDRNPTIQMSVRMKASDYDRFRALAKTYRRTNGETIKLLMAEMLTIQENRQRSRED